MPLSSRRLAVVTVAVAALAAAGLGTYFITDGRAKDGRKATQGPPPVPVSVETATRKRCRCGCRRSATWSHTTVAVKSRVDGQIIEVHFREGQEVKKSQVLFNIDARPFEAALKQAEAAALRDVASRDQAASQERRYQDCSTRISSPGTPTRNTAPTRRLPTPHRRRARRRSRAPSSISNTR